MRVAQTQVRFLRMRSQAVARAAGEFARAARQHRGAADTLDESGCGKCARWRGERCRPGVASYHMARPCAMPDGP
ncbi:hypothetical protein BBJ41_27635 [Burkholderia stabilis]|nr:hypothetical protein BBJ41_27635 [Burkholderia stabilis]